MLSRGVLDEGRQALPSTTQRGYGWQHQQLRRRLIAEWGNRPCVRCGEPIEQGQPVDLDHRDDRQGYNGLAHAACNRSVAGRKAFENRARDPRPESRTAW